MPIIDPKEAYAKETVSRFGGVQSRANLSAPGAEDMQNFRILSDGSLEKRCGFYTRMSLNAPIRGAWEGSIGGVTHFFAVAGSTVYRLNEDEEAPTEIYTLATEEGPVGFAYYRNRLYLFDKGALLCYRSGLGTFSDAEGYTPLYGRLWHPTEMGEVNEGLNLIQNRIRIQYYNGSGSTTFQLPFTCKKIDYLKINGSYVYSYSFTPSTSHFSIPTALSTSSSVEVCATLDNIFSRRDAVLQATRPLVYTDPYHETLLLTGGSPSYYVYRSSKVTDDMLAGSNAFYGNSDALYIRENTAFTVGSSQHPVTAMTQSRQQVLVFNDRTTWAIRHASIAAANDDMEILLLHAGVGCSSPMCAASNGNDTVTVGESGVTRIHFPTSDLDECKIEILSAPIERHLGRAFLRRAILHWRRDVNELWLRDPQASDGRIWVYQFDTDAWVAFDGLPATCLFEWQGALGYGSLDGTIHVRSEELTQDDGKPIPAFYQSHYMALSHPECFKRALRASLCVESDEGELGLRLETEREEIALSLHAEGDAPELFDRRFAAGRFRFLRYRITANGSGKCRIHFLTLAANN